MKIFFKNSSFPWNTLREKKIYFRSPFVSYPTIYLCFYVSICTLLWFFYESCILLQIGYKKLFGTNKLLNSMRYGVSIKIMHNFKTLVPGQTKQPILPRNLVRAACDTRGGHVHTVWRGGVPGGLRAICGARLPRTEHRCGDTES